MEQQTEWVVWAFQERIKFARDNSYVWYTNEVRYRRSDALNELKLMYERSRQWKKPPSRRSFRVIRLIARDSASPR